MKIPFNQIPLTTRDGTVAKDAHSRNMVAGKKRAGLTLLAQLPAGDCQCAFESPLGPAIIISNNMYVVTSLGVTSGVAIPGASGSRKFRSATLSDQITATPMTILQDYGNLWIVSYTTGVPVVAKIPRGIITTAQSPSYAATVTAAGAGGTDGNYLLDISTPIGLGAGAAGNYQVLSGLLHSITITTGGDGYLEASKVALRFSTVVLGGSVTGGTIVSGGTGGTQTGTFPLVITDSSGAGSGATGTYTLSSFPLMPMNSVVTAITITTQGVGYTTPANISFSFNYGGVTGVSVTPIISVAGSISSVTIEAAGSGGVAGTYAMLISDTSGGSGAGGTYTVGAGGGITSAVITSGGSNYFTPSTILIYTSVPGASLTPYTALGGAAGTVTVNNIPQAMLPSLSLLDETYYVMDMAGQIHGSDLSAPTVWQALNYTTISGGTGNPVALARHGVYLLAFSDSYLMPYYDNANPPPGSPLLPVLSAYADIGLASTGSLTTVGGIGGVLLFVGKSATAGMSIYMMSGLNIQPVSTTDVDRILDKYLLPDIPSAGVVNSKAICLKVDGKDLYILTIYSGGAAIITLVLDLQGKAWCIWSSGVVSAPDPIIPNVYTQSGFLYNTQVDSGNGSEILIHDTSGSVCVVSPSVYQDNGIPIDVSVVTPLIEGETSDYMEITAAEVLGDKVTSTGYLRFTRDDYTTWTGYQPVNLASNRSRVVRQGAARQRAYEFRHTDNTPLNLRTLDLHILTEGSQ